MLNLFKAAIKKEPNAKSEGNGGDLDDFFSKGAGKDGSKREPTTPVSNSASTPGNGTLQSNSTDLGAEELGLVIRDLDKEREETAKQQTGSTENDLARSQADTSDREAAVAIGAFDTSGTVADSGTEARPSSIQNVAEGVSVDEPFPRSLNNEADEHAGSEVQDVNEVGELIQSAPQREDNEREQGDMDEEAAHLPPNEAFPREHNDESASLTQQAAEEEHNEIEDGSSISRGRDQEALGDAGQDDDGLEDAAWQPRNLDEETGPQSTNGGFESDYDPESQGNAELQSEAGSETPDNGDEAGDVDDNRSDGGHEAENEGNYGSETPIRSSQMLDTRSDMDEAQSDELEGAMTPTLDEAEDMGAYSDLDGSEGEDADDINSNIDETVSEQNYDTDMEDAHSDFDKEYDDGTEFDETNAQSDYGVDSELADDVEQDGEHLDEIDQGSQFEDNASRDDGEERSQGLDENSDGDNDFAGEDFNPDVEEQNSIISDDHSEEGDSLNREDDVEQAENHDIDEALEGDADLEGDEHLEGDEDIDGDEDMEQGDDLHEDDGLGAADQDSRLSGSGADEEELSETGSNLGSQADLDISPPENPLSVPIGEWTEAHMEAFRIHFRSKANVFDFLARKGVANRERVSSVVTEALKLCLKDSTALRGKTHATVFLEAGGTPLGPFLAFLALTVQSTMNSTKDEKNAKGEKIVKDEEKPGEDEESPPPASADEPDPWDDFDPEDDLEAPPSHLEPPKADPAPPRSNHAETHVKRPEVATNVMVVMFLQAVLETSRAAISGPARAYLEWTFISQDLEINSRAANCKDQNDGSLHEKRSKRTAAFNLTWEDVNPLEYVSIGAQQMYSKQHYIHSGDAKAPVAAQMISMICERLRESKTPLSEYDRTTFVITSTSTAISFAYAVFTPEYIKHLELEEGLPSTQSPDLDDIVIESDPELKIFESTPYDLSKWDEALEAAELALAMVEFLQREGPLLASSVEEDSFHKESSSWRGKSSASLQSASGSPGGRFPIKVSPKQPEEPAPSEPDVEGDDDAEKLSEQGVEGDEDGAQKSLDEGPEEDRSENEERLEEDDASEQDPEDNAAKEEDAPKEEFANGDVGSEADGAFGSEHFEDDANQNEALEEGLSEVELAEEDRALNSEFEGDALRDDFTDEEEGLREGDVDDEVLENDNGEEEVETEYSSAEEEAATDIDEETADLRQGGETEDFLEEESGYEDADSDIEYQSEAPITPYSEEGEGAGRSDDQASIYDDDQYSTERSPTIEDRSGEEIIDDEYSEDGEGENFRDAYSDDDVQAEVDDDYLSEEGEGENFQDAYSDTDVQTEVDGDYLSQGNGEDLQDDLSDIATQAEINGEYLSEADGESFRDAYSDNGTQAGVDDNDLSGESFQNDPEIDDNQYSEADGGNFQDDYSDNGTQAVADDDYLSGESFRDDHEIDDSQFSEADGGNFQDGYSDNATQPEIDNDYLSEETGEGFRGDHKIDNDYLYAESIEGSGDNFSDDATQAGIEDDELALKKDFVDEEPYPDYGSDPDVGINEEYQTRGIEYDDKPDLEPSEEFIPYQEDEEGEENANRGLSSIREEGNEWGGSSGTLELEQPVEDDISNAEYPGEVTQTSHNKHQTTPEIDNPARTPLETSAPEIIDTTLYPQDTHTTDLPQAADEIYLPDTRFQQEDVIAASRPTEREEGNQNSTRPHSPQDAPPQPPPKETSPATQAEGNQHPAPDSQPKQDQAVLPNQAFEFQFGTQGQDQDQDNPPNDEDQDQDQDQSFLPDTVYHQEPSTSQKQYPPPSSSPLPSPKSEQQQQEAKANKMAGGGEEEEEPTLEPGTPVEGYLYDEATGEYYPAEEAIPAGGHYDGQGYNNSEGYDDDGQAYEGPGYDGQGYDGADYDGQGYGGNDYDYDGQGYASGGGGGYDSEEEERLGQAQQKQQPQQQIRQRQQPQQQQHVMANAF